MCQSLEEGGKRCRSCTSSVRRGKDRAAYKAKKLSTAGAVSTPSISEMELARAGVRVDDKFDVSLILSGNTDFLFKLAATKKNIKSFQALDESITIKDLEVEVRSIGAIIDARARVLSGVSMEEINSVKKELDQLIVIARKKAKAKFKRIEKIKAQESDLSTSVDTGQRTVQSEVYLLPGESEVTRVIREKLFILESGATAEVLGLIGKLKNGYLAALGEARLMGEGFVPEAWVKNLASLRNVSSGELTPREMVNLVQVDIGILPMLERQFVNRRGSVNPKDNEQLHLETYGVGEYVVEGYFIDRYIGKVPSSTRKGGKVISSGSDWEVLTCGLEAISGQRLHLGGLVGVGPGRSRHDDDMRQFVLGLLAVLEI